ncbi:MAG TPA: glycosyltransferase family 39 protein [Gemmatimonadales bacterium]|nr:glycosyltransferase family 39 protein [Gemmatimonadales bacterium]
MAAERDRLTGPAPRLVWLWAALTAARWLAAWPITEPRIFRDELLHWQMAKAYAFHQPVVLFGEAIHYPAVLYPALLSPLFLVATPRAAFHLAQALNAAAVSAVVFPAYGLARQFAPARSALAVAALSALAPSGVYSALIMEESLFYPLFVLASWFCFRALTRGSAWDGLACGVALCLAYFTKPLGLVLVGAYAIGAAAWAAAELRKAAQGSRAAALAARVVPLVVFAAVLLARRSLAPGEGHGSASELLLSRFYAEELGGPLIPPLLPTAAVALALLASLVLGVGAAPAAAALGAWRGAKGDRATLAFTAFAALVIALYVAAGARHTLVMNDSLRPHERYLFMVGPLLLAVAAMAQARVGGRVATAVVVGMIVLSVGPLGPLVLTRATSIDAPSLTLPWMLRRSLGSGWAAAALTGAAALAVSVGAARARERPVARFAWAAGLLLALNAGWYAHVYGQRSLDAMSRLIRELDSRVGRAQRLAVVITDRSEAIGRFAYYSKFWLDDRVVAYWAGAGPAPWYVDVSGPPEETLRRTGAEYLVAPASADALCPGALPAQGIRPGRNLPLVVLQAPPTGGCARN